MIDWGDAATELIGFIASFLAIGAIGFRFAVFPRWRDPRRDDALRGAAIIGIIGAAITLVMTAMYAMRATGDQRATALISAFLALLAAAGFLFAISRMTFGWMLAVIGVVFGAFGGFVPLFTGKAIRLINPAHRFFAALWIGTLFVLVVAGLGAILHERWPADTRGASARDLVAAFSPVALTSFFVLAFFGGWTGWRHLKRLDALRTTLYGQILIVKLLFVLGVVALGAFNWRRQRPLMGTEAAAASLRKSATWELVIAAIVLVITALLVAAPAPR